jgi:hypothetical protein
MESGRGSLSVERLLEIVEEQQRTIQKQQRTIERLKVEIDRLKERLGQYEPEVHGEGTPADDRSGSSSLEYSVGAEEKRRGKGRKRKRSPGRRPTEVKFAAAQCLEDVYPEGVRRAECRLVRERAVWRLKDGQAVLVGYRLFEAPGRGEGRIHGVAPRCEYGIEILVVLAFLVYVIRISLDKACAVLRFFCRLPLSKSQADALLRQLAKQWQGEFERLCDLIAHAAVVYMDETGWKMGRQGCSLWTFASQLHRVFLFGCRKDQETLDKMLPPDVFAGVAVSDDAAVYRNRFGFAQKCWAHLLRKAIRLALLYPRKKSYQRFLDQLLQLYQDAKRAALDRRLGGQGRARRVDEFEKRLAHLCRPYWRETTPDMKPHERDFANLVNELMERMHDAELFTFVEIPDVEPTNNLVERLQRDAAQDRKAGRTSKTAAGAQRRSVIVSVLESLRANLAEFTLASVLAEVRHWMDGGVGLFTRQWQAMATPATVDTS